MKIKRLDQMNIAVAIMKVFALVLIVASAAAIPLNHSKNAEEEDWHLVPDSDGHMHLVDIRSSDDPKEIAPLFNAFNDVVFRLFTRSNPTTAQPIQINNNAQLANSNFNVNHETRFQIHGWNGGGHAGTGAAIRNAYIDRGDFNVFTVDWGAGAGTINYVLARNRVNETGLVVAQFIDFLNRNGLPFARIGILGNSLGAQVAGAAGKRTILGRVQFIVGMDPAGPLFSLDEPANRLHHTDANYVEAIVTDGGRLGFIHPVAHANFYPNWGTSQPGCGIDITGQCGHDRSSAFMVESINPANYFGATRCRDLEDIRARVCVVSGPNSRLGGEPVQNGPAIVGSVYFLTTNAASPFAHGPR